MVVVYRPDDEFEEEDKDEDEDEDEVSTKMTRKHYEDSFVRLTLLVAVVVAALVSIDALEPICQLNRCRAFVGVSLNR